MRNPARSLTEPTNQPTKTNNNKTERVSSNYREVATDPDAADRDAILARFDEYREQHQPTRSEMKKIRDLFDQAEVHLKVLEDHEDDFAELARRSGRVPDRGTWTLAGKRRRVTPSRPAKRPSASGSVNSFDSKASWRKRVKRSRSRCRSTPQGGKTMFRLRKKQAKTTKTYTEAEVRTTMEKAIHATGARFTDILARAAGRALTKTQHAALLDAWQWECGQDAARVHADNPDGTNGHV